MNDLLFSFFMWEKPCWIHLQHSSDVHLHSFPSPQHLQSPPKKVNSNAVLTMQGKCKEKVTEKDGRIVCSHGNHSLLRNVGKLFFTFSVTKRKKPHYFYLAMSLNQSLGVKNAFDLRFEITAFCPE